MNGDAMTEIWVDPSRPAPAVAHPHPRRLYPGHRPAPPGRRASGRQSGADLGEHPRRALLLLTGTPYQRYFDGAQFVHFLLGPTTVALAIPLHSQLKDWSAWPAPLVIALMIGSLTAGLSAYAIGSLLGASAPTVASLAPKSVTTPIAMGIAERLGGLASLTAVFVILTGIFGHLCRRHPQAGRREG